MKLLILLLAAALRSATVIPAAPSNLIAPLVLQSRMSVSHAAAEPDQWRTGAPPARQVHSGVLTGLSVRVTPLRRAASQPRLGQARSSAIVGRSGHSARRLPRPTGIASWYPVPGYVAAVPGWRWGDTPYRLRVCAGIRCVVVTVQDWCGCPGGRIIDLSAAAFERLAPLSVGLIRVTITAA